MLETLYQRKNNQDYGKRFISRSLPCFASEVCLAAKRRHKDSNAGFFLVEFGILAFDQRADYRPYKEVIPSEFVILDNKTFYCSVNNSICAEFSF